MLGLQGQQDHERDIMWPNYLSRKSTCVTIVEVGSSDGRTDYAGNNKLCATKVNKDFQKNQLISSAARVRPCVVYTRVKRRRRELLDA